MPVSARHTHTLCQAYKNNNEERKKKKTYKDNFQLNRQND